MTLFPNAELIEVPADGIEVYRFANAGDILDALSPRMAAWRPLPADWIFRGQADASWPLLPSAFREHANRYPFAPQRTHFEQIAAEAAIVGEFVAAIDQQGLPLPTESSFSWADFSERLSRINTRAAMAEWPPKDAAPVFALAQHFGVPTRLLDWTQRANVAAYFAAVDCCARAEEGRGSTELAVWALSPGRAKVAGRIEDHVEKPPSVRLVRPPRHSNPNLRAQAGMLTVLDDKLRASDAPAFFPTLDELLIERCRADALGGGAFPILVRLELPAGQAGTLLRMLADEECDATHLFPGYEGAARALRESRYWDKKHRPRSR